MNKSPSKTKTTTNLLCPESAAKEHCCFVHEKENHTKQDPDQRLSNEETPISFQTCAILYLTSDASSFASFDCDEKRICNGDFFSDNSSAHNPSVVLVTIV
jgi:hypothetical protein